jgi:hypothetical protein
MKKYILILIAFFALMYDANATHVVGSDWQYTCIPGSNGRFAVKLTLYRDCQGVTLCPNNCGAACPYTVQLSGADPACNNTNFGSRSLTLVAVRDVNPNPRCPSSKSICNNMTCVTPGSFTPGIERYDFEGEIDLGPGSGIPSSCCNIRISYSLCCRNGAISTGSANANFYTDMVINRCLSSNPCNSSPNLTNDPFAVICSGQPFYFNNGAVDPDLDSLSYSFVPSLASQGASVTYTPPFAFDRPMPWSGPAGGTFPAGISCNPVTGDIGFTPSAGGNFVGVMAMQVQQWRWNNSTQSYQLVGTTRRDIQVWLRVCDPNNPPSLRTIPGLNGNPLALRTNWDICAGEQLCFDVIAKDTDFNPPTRSDTTYLSWNQALAGFGATFLPNYIPAQRRIMGPREDNYRFCWTPNENQGSPLPYYFTVKAEDSRCPLPGTIIRAFAIRVYERASVSITKTDHRCGNWSAKYTKNIMRQTFTTVSWSVAREPDDFTFSQGAFNFNNVVETPILSFKKPGRYLISLQIAMQGPPGQQCSKNFIDTFVVQNPLSANVRDTFVCRNNTVVLTAKADMGQPPYTYRWYNNIKDTLSPLNAPFFTNPSITVAPTQTRFYTIQVRDINGCRAWDSLKVDQKQLPIGQLLDSMRICFGSTYELEPGNNGGNIKKYQWSTGDTTRRITRNDSNNFVVELTDTFNCKQTDTLALRVNRQLFPNAGIDTSICLRDTAVLRAQGGQLYQWRNLTTGAVIKPKNHIPNIPVFPTNTIAPTRYELTVYQSYPDTTNKVLECALTDTIEITVKPLPALVRPQLVRTCFSNKQVALNTFNTNQPGGTGIWNYPPAPGAVISGPPPQVRIDSMASRPVNDTIGVFTNWVQYRYTSPASFGGCTQVDSAQVVIHGVPRVNAGSHLRLCDNGNTYELTTTANQFGRGVTPLMNPGPGIGFFWTGAGVDSIVGATKRYIFNPNRSDVNKLPGITILTYRFTHNYALIGGGTFQCANSDTTQFLVTDAPDIQAGSDIVICKNNPILNLTQQSGGFTTPNTGQEYWTSSTGFIQNAITQRVIFNPSTPGVPNNGGPWRMYMRDTSTGCAVVDSINLTIAGVPDVDLSFNSATDDEEIDLCDGTGWYPVYTKINGVLSAGTTDLSDTNYSYIGPAAWVPRAPLPPIQGALAGFNTSDASAGGNQQIIFKFVQFTAGISCTNWDTGVVKIQEPPVLSVTPGGAICSYEAGIPVSVASLQPSTYTMQWSTEAGGGSFGDATSLNTTFSPSATAKTNGRVWIYATSNPLGVCATTKDSTQITIHQAPVSSILCDSCEGCEPIHAYLAAGTTGVSNAQYNWTWSDGYGQNTSDSSFDRIIANYSNTANGKVTTRLVVSTQTTPACYDTTSRQLIVHATPEASFYAEPPFTTIARPYFDFNNTSTTPDNASLAYTWTVPPIPPSTQPRIYTDENPKQISFAADTGDIPIQLRVVSEYGCWDTTTRWVCVEPDITVFVPSAFRPGEGFRDCPDPDPECNSTFKPNASGYATIEVIVFNRWGQEVYRSNDISTGWNGTIQNKGEVCPQDVYIYMIYATSFNGKQYKYSGSVTLLR